MFRPTHMLKLKVYKKKATLLTSCRSTALPSMLCQTTLINAIEKWHRTWTNILWKLITRLLVSLIAVAKPHFYAYNIRWKQVAGGGGRSEASNQTKPSKKLLVSRTQPSYLQLIFSQGGKFSWTQLLLTWMSDHSLSCSTTSISNGKWKNKTRQIRLWKIKQQVIFCSVSIWLWLHVLPLSLCCAYVQR